MKTRRPKTHTIKCWPQYFGPVADGSKTFEIRRNRDYRVGDTLVIQEWCPTKRDFTGHECRAIVSYLTEWQQTKGNVVLGLKLLAQDTECTQLGCMREAIKEAHAALSELVSLGSLELPHRRDAALLAGSATLAKLQPFLKP